MKKSRKNEYHLYLQWPRYLAQWYAHEIYRLQHFEVEYLEPFSYNCDVEVMDLQPVETRRGSLERNVLEMFLSKRPSDYVDRPDPNSTICIVIPSFVSKPPQTYNYLSPSAAALLQQTVHNHFRVELFKYVRKFTGVTVDRQGIPITTESIINAFMENNGIEDNETNMFAIRQVWQRLSNNKRVSDCRKRKKNYENTGS